MGPVMVATTAASAAPPGTPTGRLAHIPAFDGIRAACVVAVLAFHNGFGWARGGFLGVSTFFTLSGFLITSLVLAEHRQTGALDLRGFWQRRFRRLLPATVACFALVLAFGVLAATAEQRAALGGDLLASAAYVANWWFLASGQSYAELFAAPSPLLQFWSLAIEEQFYLVFPLVAWAVTRPGRRRWLGIASPANRLAVLSALALVATTSLPFVVDRSQDWLYYATPARAPELLVGVLAAALLSGRWGASTAPSAASRWAAGVVALAASGAMVAAWVTTGQGDAWLYRGGFFAFSLLSLALLLAVRVPGHPIAQVLSLPAVRHLGAISYGVYLFHWPLFLWLDGARTGLEGWALFAVRLAVTLAVAELSFRFIERPVRATGRLVPTGPLAPWTALRRWVPTVTVLIVVAGFAASATAPASAVDIDRASDQMALATLPDPAPGGAEQTSGIRVGLFGDSTAMMTSFGLGTWLGDQGLGRIVSGATRLGCGVALGGDRRGPDGRVEAFAPSCTDWPVVFAQAARAATPDVAVVQVGAWDIDDRRFTPNGPFLSPGDPAWDEAVLDELTGVVDTLTDAGSYVVWLTAPAPNDASSLAGAIRTDRARRLETLNALVAQLPERRPGAVQVIDLHGWFSSIGADEDRRLRPDGVHTSAETSDEVATRFLGPALRDLWRTAQGDGSLAAVRAAARQRWVQLPPLVTRNADETTRVVVWGDERAPEVARTLSAGADVRVVADDGCGISAAVARLVGTTEVPTSDRCRGRTDLRQALAEHRPHVVVIAGGSWEQSTMRTHPGERTADLSNHTTTTWVATQVGLAVDALRQTGSRVVVVNLDHVVDPSFPFSALAPPARLNTIFDGVTRSQARAGWVTLVDLRTTPLADGLAAALAEGLTP
jgi:peptidoglycan/LPS O-acetylase OafA/YrhL